MRVVFLTTSYPRDERDYAGRFVADLADRLRERGVEVDVVAPGAYRDFGLAYGAGLTKNAVRKPWAVPPLLASMARTVRREARNADLVHAHWLPTVAPALASGRPLVTTLHGSDVALLKRFPPLLRLLVRRVRVAVAVSDAVADTVRGLGATNVRVIRNGVEVPAATTRRRGRAARAPVRRQARPREGRRGARRGDRGPEPRRRGRRAAPG